MKKKKKNLTIAFLMLGTMAIFLSTTGTSPEKQEFFNKQKTPPLRELVTPTVFVHGFMGDDDSMSTLLEGVTGIHSLKRKSVSIYNRSNSSSLSFLNFDGQEKTYIVKDNYDVLKYSFKGGQKGILKVIFFNQGEVFENAGIFNHAIVTSSAGSINDNSLYLKAAMEEITKDYGNRSVNLVGHSMGGVTSANYALDMYSKVRIVPTSQAVQVNKLVTLGSPFKGSRFNLASIKNGKIGETLAQNLLNGGAEVRKRFRGKNIKFNPDMKVLSFASPYDKVVSTDSAFGMEAYIEKENLKKIKTTGTHSLMMSQEETIKQIKKFLR